MMNSYVVFITLTDKYKLIWNYKRHAMIAHSAHSVYTSKLNSHLFRTTDTIATSLSKYGYILCDVAHLLYIFRSFDAPNNNVKHNAPN